MFQRSLMRITSCPIKNHLAGESAFGQELDLALRYDFIKKAQSVSWGGSVFLPGDLIEIILENYR